MLWKLTREGVIEIAVSRTEISLRVAGHPESTVVRVARKGILH